MVVGSLEIRAVVSDAQSLKDKRHVLKSFKDIVKNKFNVAVAEVDDNDLWQKTTLGIATVGNDAKFVNSVLDNVVNFVRVFPGLSLIDYDLDVI